MLARRQSWFLCCFALFATSGGSTPGAASELGPGPAAPPSIAVAHFSPDAAIAPAELDVAALLAGQLSESLPTDVVAPTAFGEQGSAQPEASEVRAWAERARVDAIVLGRTTVAPGGGAVGVDVEVRSGHSGVATATYHVPFIALDDPKPAVADLAASILRGLGYEPPAVVESAENATRKEEEAEEGSGFKLFKKGEPISIQSDELEVTQDGDGRHLVFRRAVRVSQGDIQLRTEQLDAYYTKGESQPDRLVASGAVRVRQGDRRARCEHAIFLNAEQRLICTGRASLVQGCDLVRGAEIRFDLREERVYVTGGASVVIQDRDDCSEEKL